MASAADPVVSSVAPAAAVAVENNSKSKKTAASKDSKAKKSSGAKKTKSSPTHPPFFQMISEAIVSLKERTGSSQYAITKFSEEKHKVLPSNFRKLLLVHLKKLVAADKLVKVKNSYKLPSARSVQQKSSSAPVVAKKTTISKLKAAASVKKAAAVAKPKAKTAVKPKPNAVVKPKTVAKSKVVQKPKAAAVAKPKAAEKVKKVAPKPKPKSKASKVAKTLSRTSPGKRVAPATKPKKVAVKKSKTVKSPTRKLLARKVKK
ncbi:histone H1-like [Cucurbita moschata]|uniref:Histone H1-like n=1 Tax=Cucurbita moschata TaxID=3662 RepID=A0A6J1FIZ7_CUCMO|nr:histone H1-like [Cucurbita moschata]